MPLFIFRAPSDVLVVFTAALGGPQVSLSAQIVWGWPPFSRVGLFEPLRLVVSEACIPLDLYWFCE